MKLKDIVLSGALLLGGCNSGSSVYTPFPEGGQYKTGSVATYPWSRNPETFENTAVGPIECSSDKTKVSYLDVTAGCLSATKTGGGAYTRGWVSLTNPGGAFRTVVLGGTKWTDQAIQYRFYHQGEGDIPGVNPGFKAFARYQNENNLYVASWRFDGVIQIQEKRNGVYRTIVRIDGQPPSAGAWHSIRFEAKGQTLSLYLDGVLQFWASEPSGFSWGTVGIRIDSADGAFLDDIKVVNP